MKTKQKKELVYAAIIAGLSSIVIIFLFTMFLSKKDRMDGAEEDDAVQIYQAGVYTKKFHIGDTVISIRLCLDESNIKSVELVNLDNNVSTMYPLMVPTVEKISKQLSSGISLDEIVLSDESQYTEKLILETIREMLQEHRVSQVQ